MNPAKKPVVCPVVATIQPRRITVRSPIVRTHEARRHASLALPIIVTHVVEAIRVDGGDNAVIPRRPVELEAVLRSLTACKHALSSRIQVECAALAGAATCCGRDVSRCNSLCVVGDADLCGKPCRYPSVRRGTGV